jgi:DNA-binding MarR family transcriptional regulator
MSLEKDIQQEVFRNNYQKATVNIIYTANWLNEHIKNYLFEDEVTPQQYNILRILRGSKKPLSTLQIRARMLDKMSDTSRIVDRLILKGWAEKTICRADKRLVDVVITDNGLDLLKKLDQKDQLIDNTLAKLNEKEVELLNVLLDKIREKGE